MDNHETFCPSDYRMITLFTGAPGSGKSAACVALLAELAKGRTIYANGVPDLAIPHEILDDPTTWHQTVPDGSIIFIDEVQRIWRPRGPGQKVPADIQALETHRHRGIDFYIVTQGPRLVDSNIRALTGRHVHLRDVGILGRYWYEWPECADNCATGWKNAPIKKRYGLPKHAFALYKSASVHIKPIRSIPWMLAVMVLALLVTLFVSFKAYSSISAKMAPAVAPVVTVAGVASKMQGNSEPQNAPVDYAASFVPRVDGLPHTAPRYDTVTAPVEAPYPAACISMGKRCKCYTQQGTVLDTSLDICKQVVANGIFVDWDNSPKRGSEPPKQPLQGNPGASPAVALPEAFPVPARSQAGAVADGQTIATMRKVASL